MNKYRVLFFVIIIVITITGIFLFFSVSKKKEGFRLTPEGITGSAGEQATETTEVGTGWSANEKPAEAAREAVEMALKGKKEQIPDFAVVFATSGSDLQAILTQLNSLFGNKTKIYGGTSDSRGVLTDKGFVKATERGYEQALMEGKRSLALMTVTSKDIAFGVGSADFSLDTPVREASKERGNCPLSCLARY
jgi:hypothetical protein